MAAKELRSMEIEPAENGGHTITHRYKSKPAKKGGSIVMDYPESESHVFGPSDGHQVIQHISKHLGIALKGMSTKGLENADDESAAAE